MTILLRRRVAPAPAAQQVNPVLLRRRTIPIVPGQVMVERRAVPREEMSPETREALATIRRYAEKIKNPMTAIRAKCVECSGGSLKEVAECRVPACALHPFRMGKNPLRKKREGGYVPSRRSTDSDDDGDIE